VATGTTEELGARHTSAEEAVGLVRPGDHVFVGSACGTPRTLVEALELRDPPPEGVVLVHSLTDHVGVGDPLRTAYRHRVFYVGGDARALSDTGSVEYVPVSLADVPRLCRDGLLRLDVALVQVAPPDDDGTCSLGVSVDVTRDAALAARTVIAEVNPAMPRTAGASRIPVERLDRMVAVDRPLAEYVHEAADGVAEQIARYVARLIDDASTLQVGLGRVPNRMLAHLTNRAELAFHSDVLTEPVVDLVESGVVTGQVVASFAMGTRRLYDLIDGNPRFSFHPVDRVCDPAVISAMPRFVSITQAFSIDLTGQVCTEALDGVVYGGVSTGPSFHRGALASPGGKAIVCLASRTPAGSPAVKATLGLDEPVAIARAEVHWVITEYGTAYLFGRSTGERAISLIEIAHPDDRPALLAEAASLGLVPAGREPRSRSAYPLGEERDVQLRDGRETVLRPTRAGDLRAMQELFFRLGEEDVRTRFFHKLSSLTDRAAHHLCSVDHDGEMAFAAVVGPAERERIVGASCYYVDPATRLAEVAYMIDPEWQGAGLGSLLHAHTVEYARGHGVRGFTADVLVENGAMLRVFRSGDHELSLTTAAGAYEVTMLFEAASG
jgi:acyl-CoA hydrolase/RimJ/RimL family protein N-acetyltransferase